MTKPKLNEVHEVDTAPAKERHQRFIDKKRCKEGKPFRCDREAGHQGKHKVYVFGGTLTWE